MQLTPASLPSILSICVSDIATIRLRRQSSHDHRLHRCHPSHPRPFDQTVHIKCIIIWLSVLLPLVTTLASSPFSLSNIQPTSSFPWVTNGKLESALVSNPSNLAVRSDNGSLQKSAGVHLRLKSAQDLGLLSSTFTAELIKTPLCLFLQWHDGSVCFIRIVVVDQGYMSGAWGCSPLKEVWLRTKVLRDEIEWDFHNSLNA